MACHSTTHSSLSTLSLQLHLLQLDRQPKPPSIAHPRSPLSTHSLSTHQPSNTSEPHQHHCTLSSTNILFFIRLPKCASTTFVDFLYRLSKPSDFFLEFNPSGAYNWKEEEKISVSQQCSRRLLLKNKLVYARHFYFIDFTEYGIINFSYVTIIRNPIDRVVSSYLYYHFSSRKHIQYILKPEHRNESLSTCLLHQHEGCTHNLVTKYFCGHAAWCKLGDKRALNTAKSNLRNHFAVVGVMEDMQLSVEVMRRILPQFFAVDSQSNLTLPALNKNEKEVMLSEDERLEIARTNAADMELYEYALQLLHDQATQCGIA